MMIKTFLLGFEVSKLTKYLPFQNDVHDSFKVNEDVFKT